MKVKHILIAAAAIVLAAACGNAQNQNKGTSAEAAPASEQQVNQKVGNQEGDLFVDFEVPQEDGSIARLSDYVGKGKFILVDFWASWCGPCRMEIPVIKKVYEQYHGDRFDVVSVAVADEIADTKAAIEEEQIPWNQIIGGQQIPGEAYGFEYIPYIVLFGPDGTILRCNLRGEAIGEAVAAALGE